MEMVTELVADALRQARFVRKYLDAKIIPLLDPRHRTFATNISRRLVQRDILNEALLIDLDAFLAVIGEAIENGTTLTWRGHEHDPNCGYTMPVRSDAANALLYFQGEIVDLVTAIEGALDAAKA
ncbi:MAG: hypothetical protein LPK88_14000, partial [Alphaproteobacteria bacterium]|nr:hypothetical protein [Alphaproteobacteria bacterium]